MDKYGTNISNSFTSNSNMNMNMHRKSSPSPSSLSLATAASTRSISSSSSTRSPFFAPKPPRKQLVTTPNGTLTQVQDTNEDKESKSSILGAAFNLSNNIVGAGIVGIPFAISQCSLVVGTIMVAFFGVMTVKSLRLLIETAKHVDVPSYERLAEASFGKSGYTFISIAMFIMSYGGMVGYLMIIKNNLSFLVGVEEDDTMMRNAVLTLSSLMVLLPISLQRDMGNLAKTSTISVIFDVILVGIVATFSPSAEMIENKGGFKEIIRESKLDITTFFTGIGVLCFAFVCQHSSFIIASSLERPTKERWNKVTSLAITTCAILAIIMGVGGYLGFMADTDGDILVNLGKYAPTADIKTQQAANIARGLLCMTMFFVYPMELFVARHVCVVLLFKGRRAHEGDDHAVLARRDRRVTVTAGIYLLTLIPALVVDDLGSVFSISGALGGATLSYMGPGLMYIAVHGEEFLDTVAKRWGRAFIQKYSTASSEEEKKKPPQNFSLQDDVEYHIQRSRRYDKKVAASSRRERKGITTEFCASASWYILLMPLWCKIAAHGKQMLKEHEEAEVLKSPYPYAFGKIIHHKPHLNKEVLKDKRSQYAPSPATSEIEGDFLDGRPIARVGSLPAMLKPMNSYTSLQDLNFSHGTSKKKVGFVAQDSLGNQLTVNEKERLLSQYQPISAQSFNAASFEVMRPSYSGSSTIFEDDVRVQNNVTRSDYGSNVQNLKPVFQKKKSNEEDIENDGKGVGLELEEGGFNKSKESNVYDNDMDVEFEFSQTFESDTGHEMDGLISHGSLPGGDEGLLSHDSERSNLYLGEKDHSNHDNGHDGGLTSFDHDINEEESHSSSVFVEEEVDEEMYESDCASDASSVRVAPSPLIQSSIQRQAISTYSKYDNIKANPLILNQIRQKATIVSITKASPNSMKEMCEDDPQDDPPSISDFFIAIFYVLFGFVAAFAGMFSAFSS